MDRKSRRKPQNDPVVVEVRIKFEGVTDGAKVKLDSHKVFEWYLAHYLHLDQALHGGKVLQLKRTREGMAVQFRYENRDENEIRVFAEILADPDDDGNYPIGTFDGQKLVYDSDFLHPTATSNVLVTGRVLSLKLLKRR